MHQKLHLGYTVLPPPIDSMSLRLVWRHLCDFYTHFPSWDISVGKAVDCHATGPGFNTHSTWPEVDSDFHLSVGR